MTTAAAFTINHTVDQHIIDELETEFDAFRGRIALLSIEACGTLTGIFTPMIPAELEVIDIDAIEAEQFELELGTLILPFAAA